MLDEEFQVKKYSYCEHFQLMAFGKSFFTRNVFMVLVSYTCELNLKLQELHAKDR